jgi:hypothetical protein
MYSPIFEYKIWLVFIKTIITDNNEWIMVIFKLLKLQKYILGIYQTKVKMITFLKLNRRII